MIKVERTYPAPSSLETERLKANGESNKDDVKTQLYNDFAYKCYICEVILGQDTGHVEHLEAHRDDKDKKFNWDNIFLSCAHCNGVKKGNKYGTGILNCTLVDPAEHFYHTLSEDKVEVKACGVINSHALTGELIEEVFNGTIKSTASQKLGETHRLQELKNEMQIFYKTLGNYIKKPSKLSKQKVVALLDKKTRLTAFKRDYIRMNSQRYSEIVNSF